MNQNKGETLTFLQLFTEKKWKIEIPIIQRDYAQGRAKSKDIRDLFLSNLYQHLESGKRIDLDFVYGSLNTDGGFTTFIPLDGQQRLTTLFLLHWYLANKDEVFESFSDVVLRNKKSLFTYETRVSSSEFCDCLSGTKLDLSQLLPADENKNNSLSKTIKDLSWFFISWGTDPTVKSMMTMLDDIHAMFNASEGLYAKLSSAGSPVILFQFLNLEAFELTDDLYIKMNARGKLLSAFENFKAWLQNYIQEKRIQVDEAEWELIQVEGRDHVRNFHHYFFTLDPDEKVIRHNLAKALYLADNSAKSIYDDLKESGYYSGIISGNISQEIIIDSIRMDIANYPYRFRCYATQEIIRPTSIVTRALVTEGALRNVSRSDNNPHGFLIERWRTIDNRDLRTENRN